LIVPPAQDYGDARRELAPSAVGLIVLHADEPSLASSFNENNRTIGKYDAEPLPPPQVRVPTLNSDGSAVIEWKFERFEPW
jgi:hypothetical protein